MHEIYVNTAIDDGSEISELMQCFLQTDVNNKKFPKFSQRVYYFKHIKFRYVYCIYLRKHLKLFSWSHDIRSNTEAKEQLTKYDKNYQQTQEKIAKYRPIDDTFFEKIAEDHFSFLMSIIVYIYPQKHLNIT